MWLRHPDEGLVTLGITIRQPLVNLPHREPRGALLTDMRRWTPGRRHTRKVVRTPDFHRMVLSGVDAYIADQGMRRRRARQRGRRPSAWFTPADFHYDATTQTCICPAGERLYRSGVDVISAGYRGPHFKAPKRTCRPCALRRQCLRHPERTVQRQVMFFTERRPGTRRAPWALPAIEAMKRKIDSALGRWIYSRRIATVEPVFANLQNKGMRRFTLRGRAKESTQWKLFTLVHNIEKIAICAA